MNASLPACMGGFCSYRDNCARHLTPYRDQVSERLCERGHEVPISRSSEHTHQSLASVVHLWKVKAAAVA